MKQVSIAISGIVAIAIVSGCATKRYPIATSLSPVEVSLMDCRELMIEDARTEEVQRQITDSATTDWRSVAGFLGDFGLGNAMAKSEAEAALSEKRASIRAAQVNKRCLNIPESTTSGRSDIDAIVKKATER